ncbi:unnamed protein product [Prunus armeniaca]|uniref:Uncharacterized protein n=1 Tax=Prunus armeniaca TaxID=36596 RepID=A0A6J5W1W4_PRUAR|nr:unnamed protein product [Prunus armeniaca]
MSMDSSRHDLCNGPGRYTSSHVTTVSRRARQEDDGVRVGKWNQNDMGIASQQLTSQIGVRQDDRAKRHLSIQWYINLPTPSSSQSNLMGTNHQEGESVQIFSFE